MDADAKTLNKILQTKHRCTLEGSHTTTKWDSFLGWKDGSAYIINVIYHINKMKGKEHIIISNNTGKVFDEMQHPFM